MFIFLGIAQGIFLGSTFFFAKPILLVNRLLACLLWVFVAVIGEIFLCYTNLMFQTLWLVDVTEPVNFLIAPLLYLYFKTCLQPTQIRLNRSDYLHFIPFGLYALYMSILVFPQSLSYKYNAYIDAFHPSIPHIPTQVYWAYKEAFWWRDNINEFTFLHFFVYQILSFRLLWQTTRLRKVSFWTNQDHNLAWVRKVWLQFLTLLVLFLIVKLSFENDLGDHILAVHTAFMIYMVSFQAIRKSVFLQPLPASGEKVGKKYEKSSLTPELQAHTLQKLKILMQTEKPFLHADFSLPALAQKLNVSVHHLSQILNEQLHQNFFEYVATYRITEAQELLRLPEMAHLKIDEIAERVGYSSKSSFNTTFKKIVGRTPSEYKKGM